LGGGSARRKAATYTGQHKQNKRTQTSTPLVGFEPTIPVFERAKTVHALDRAANVVGSHDIKTRVLNMLDTKLNKSEM
jgi:hypothetical protein